MINSIYIWVYRIKNPSHSRVAHLVHNVWLLDDLAGWLYTCDCQMSHTKHSVLSGLKLDNCRNILYIRLKTSRQVHIAVAHPRLVPGWQANLMGTLYGYTLHMNFKLFFLPDLGTSIHICLWINSLINDFVIKHTCILMMTPIYDSRWEMWVVVGKLKQQ